MKRSRTCSDLTSLDDRRPTRVCRKSVTMGAIPRSKCHADEDHRCSNCEVVDAELLRPRSFDEGEAESPGACTLRAVYVGSETPPSYCASADTLSAEIRSHAQDDGGRGVGGAEDR